ncbi:putative F-box domain-containing protein [Rosa chinensis]|uniref:Putative F-box domain-containing protein n=1 Tax=Rosa chinensis TaxID=74649 RepID=A0A2P6RSS3_ROSCH|nr:F-box protein At5g39450 [Rosa chinensis]PRQ49484.1 putative F-box domain-containing protein [Rosa chinensis]
MSSAESCGSSLLLALSDDVFSIITCFLSLKDLCNLGLCCRNLYALVDCEKVWLTQCEQVGIVPLQDLIEWRKAVSSYKALCRFLFSVQPLMGIWVHQNPELGNVVYVMPGFVSVVGCRVIPQELGPLGIEDGPILWAPVFEIIGDFDGSTAFFLHGRDKGCNYVYPGLVKPVGRSCNVLLLEIEPRQPKNEGESLLHSKSFVHCPDQELSKNICRSNSGLSRSQRVFGQGETLVPFRRLAFSDRRKLLDVVTSQIRLKVPDGAIGPLFPQLRDDEENFQKDMVLLSERRSMLLQMCKLGEGHMDLKASSQLPCDRTQLQLNEFRKSLDRTSDCHNTINEDAGHRQSPRKKSLGRYFKDSLNQILGKSISFNGNSKNSSSSSENKYASLPEFLSSGDTIGLSLHASTVKLSSYRAWPNMHDSRFAIYKLPLRIPTADQEYAGLWGGTFGWPPGKPTKDKPGKALFFLLLSYEECQGQQHLIATKILEGTHYVLHPNGSAMFIVNIDEPSTDPFPWDTDVDSLNVNIKHALKGEGIANGYGFRYPGSKPGSLFVFQDGHLAFIWKESRAVLTLQRINLQELLRKGERVPALPPIANFSYLTKSFSNVFAEFANTSTTWASAREEQSDALGENYR